MTQTTTAIGRLQIAHADLGYDTNDGGTNLHASLRSMYTKFADHLMWRQVTFTIANGASLPIVHNFGLNLVKLKYLIFEGGVQNSLAQNATNYTIAETGGGSTSSLTITNISGVSKTLTFCVFGGKMGISTGDFDPAVSIDTTGDIRAATLRTLGDLIIINHDAVGSGVDWKGTLTRPTAGMSADAVWVMPTTSQVIPGRDNVETLTNKTFTSTGPITFNAGAALDWAASAVSIGASVGANTLTVGGALSTVYAPGTLDGAKLNVRDDDVVINSDAVLSGADWKATLRRPSSGMSANAVHTLPVSTGTLVGRNTVDTLTNKTLTGPVVSDFMRFTAIATPATPAAGGVSVYAKSDDKLYILNSSGVETQVGSGSGSGGINYAGSNYNFEGTANGATPAGWSAYTDTAAAIPTDGTGGTIDATITFLASTTSPIRDNVSAVLTKPATNCQGKGWSLPFTIAAPDRSLMHQIQFEVDTSSANYVAGDLVVYIYDVTNATIITPTAVSIVKLTNGKFYANFMASSALSYRLILHIATVNATAWTAKFDSFLINAERVGTGYAGGEWESTTSYVISAQTTAPTPGAGATFYRRTVRDGEDAIIHYEFVQTAVGTGGSGAYRLPLPTGLTINQNKISKELLNATAYSVGQGAIQINSNAYAITAYAASLNSVGLSIDNQGASGTGYVDWGSTNGGLNNTTVRIGITVRLPINEWAGSGTLNMGAGAQPEYASNSDSSATISVTGSGYVSGSAGSLFPTRAPTTGAADTVRRVYFSRNIQVGDRIQLEATYAQNIWIPIGNSTGIETYSNQGTTGYGMGWQNVAGVPNAIDVYFGGGGRVANGTTYQSTGATFSGFGSWRAVLATPSAPVGFGLATNVNGPGLYTVGQQEGSNGVTAPGVGKVGEQITETWSAATAVSSTLANVGTSRNLSAGIWLITWSNAMGLGSGGSSTSQHETRLLIDGVSGSTWGKDKQSGGIPTANQTGANCSGSLVLSKTATWTLQAQAICTFSGASGAYYGAWTALRVA